MFHVEKNFVREELAEILKRVIDEVERVFEVDFGGILDARKDVSLVDFVEDWEGLFLMSLEYFSEHVGNFYFQIVFNVVFQLDVLFNVFLLLFFDIYVF